MGERHPLSEDARAVLLAEALGALHEIGVEVGQLRQEVMSLHESFATLPLERWSCELDKHLEDLASFDLRANRAAERQALLAGLRSDVRDLVRLEYGRERRWQRGAMLVCIFLLGLLSSSVVYLWK